MTHRLPFLQSFLILIAIATLPVYANVVDDTFSLAGHTIPPGCKYAMSIPITAKDATTFIPITVIRGREQGITLSITAGIHGYEYPPIIASQVLADVIDPETVKGTIIIVHLADVSAFLGRSPFINPVDRKNLNRAFPGNKAGTITEAIAAFITEHVIKPADVFVDLHGGDASEDLSAYAAFYQNPGRPELSANTKTLASKTGFDKVVAMQLTSESLDSDSLYCSYEAFQQGKLAIDIECGKLGTANPDDIALIKDGMLNLMAHLALIPGQADETKAPTKYISQRIKSVSQFQGIFHASKQAGDRVKAGMKLGYITDFFGNKLTDIEATSDGIILIMITTPPVNEGDTIAVIGQLD